MKPKNQQSGQHEEGQTNQPAARDIGNIGDAVMYGVESLFDFNLKKIFKMNTNFSLNYLFLLAVYFYFILCFTPLEFR